MGTNYVPLMCYYDGELEHATRNPIYVGGHMKADRISKDVSFPEFVLKMNALCKSSPKETTINIKCRYLLDQHTSIAMHVDDENSLNIIMDLYPHHCNAIVAYIEKQSAQKSITTTQSNHPSEILPGSDNAEAAGEGFNRTFIGSTSDIVPHDDLLNCVGIQHISVHRHETASSSLGAVPLHDMVSIPADRNATKNNSASGRFDDIESIAIDMCSSASNVPSSLPNSLGQNLKISAYIWEICFALSICFFGLLLFTLLIVNVQSYLQSNTLRSDEMRVKLRDIEQWMSHRMLPKNLRERIRRYELYKWEKTGGVDEETLLCNLPKDLRRDVKRNLCLALIKRVPMFESMDEKLLDAMCDRLKPALYTEKSFIIQEGDHVDEMLFIMRGKLLSVTTNGGRIGFFNSDYLKAGDFCGEELLTWALDPHSSNLPISTRTVQALTEVEAFALVADDLKFVASQFRRLHSKLLQHTFRFYSQQWRTWAACFIQAAWRRYCKKKMEESLREEEDRLQDALANNGGSSSLGATIYMSRFATNALRAIRRNRTRKTRLPERLPPIMLQKPAEPDFSSEDR